MLEKIINILKNHSEISVNEITKDSLLIADLGVAFSKEEKDFPVESLSEVLDEMKKDGTIKNIVIKYGLDPEKVSG